MNRFITALQFLTVFRVKGGGVVAPDMLARSMSLFPLVGAVQGAVIAGAALGLSLFLPWTVASALALALLVITTGGLHLDGFADTVDGLAGGTTPEERLRIMKDPAAGPIGVVFLVLLILVKYLAVMELPALWRLPVLFAFPVAGRWAMVPMACLAGYARDSGGLGKSFASNSSSTLLIATAVAAAVLFLALGLRGLVVLAVLGAWTWPVTIFFRRRLGGVTGDVFGFHNEVAELVFLLLCLALAGLGAGPGVGGFPAGMPG
ncbi:MAG: adenosylcobinamide-GDP ribazoletransferase [Thermodesulfobacteriota bacterium]